jgi:hypothetical protein
MVKDFVTKQQVWQKMDEGLKVIKICVWLKNFEFFSQFSTYVQGDLKQLRTNFEIVGATFFLSSYLHMLI